MNDLNDVFQIVYNNKKIELLISCESKCMITMINHTIQQSDN
jgi:hypothetical protein